MTVDSNEQKLAIKEALRSQQPDIVKALWNARAVDLWIDRCMQSPQQAQLSLLLWTTPNLEQLTLGTYDGSLIQLLGLELGANAPDFDGYAKLDTLEIYTDGEKMPEDGGGDGFPTPEAYDHRISTLRHLPALRHYRHLYPCDVHDALAPASGLRPAIMGGGLDNLRTLHLDKTLLRTEQIVSTVSSCNVLEESRYRPLGIETLAKFVEFKPICEALLPSKNTLQYVYLSMGEQVSDRNWFDYSYPSAGYFTQFDKLRTLVLPVGVLMGATGRPEDDPHTDIEDIWEKFEFQSRITENLPISITSLGLSRCQGKFFDRDLAVEAAEQLVDNKDELPHLQALYLLDDVLVRYPTEENLDLHYYCIEKGIDFVAQNSLGDEDLLIRHYRTII